MHYKKIWISLGIVYIIAIFFASLSKIPDVQIQLNYTDKVVHFTMYFILVGWFVQLYKNSTSRLFILLSAICLGLLIELLQLSYPHELFG